MRVFSILFLCVLTPVLYGQRSIEAIPTSERIVIDGEFKESTWNSAQSAAEFIQRKPNPGKPSTQNTEVQIAYDNFAIYIAARCFDKPEHVSKVLCQRDDFNANIDAFQIILDTYNDDQNAFTFGVSSMGVQIDAKFTIIEQNTAINMAWYSAVVRNEEGWQVEMKIPYSAFRFPNKEVQNWGINFYRYISRNREESSWNPIRPDFENFVAQCGNLTNVKGIKPPLRLAFMPYVSSYANHYPLNQDGKSNWTGSFNGGMDIKLGLNEAFTLDMTLVPDFGQVVFDNKILNLSPFEIQFNENRQFFTEGIELFSKSDLFYSRRIGLQSPGAVLNKNLNNDEAYVNDPPPPQLFNSTKISGRTKKGLGIGIFNAITAEQKAVVVNEENVERTITASPLTNYNVFVLDQNLKNNSSITLTNTNVMRDGSFYDANVTGLNTKFNSKNNKWFISARGAISNLMDSSTTSTGHNWGVSSGKQTGALISSIGYFEESANYNPNDLGFNRNNNKRIISASCGYRIFDPFWKINQFSTNLNINYNRLYAPDAYTSTIVKFSTFLNTKKFHAMGIRINSSITDSYDYFEPRSPGRFFIQPKSIDASVWVSSNYQKKLAIDLSFESNFTDIRNWMGYNIEFSPRIRISNRLFLIYTLEQSFLFNARGYAVTFGKPNYTSEAIQFGSRDRSNTINTIDLAYTMTKNMGVTFRLRHYRSSIIYDSFFDLQWDGSLQSNTNNGLDSDGKPAYDINYNAFTIDFVYRWIFLPGSELSIVWKNAIFSSDKNVKRDYFNNLSTILGYDPLNSFSLKVIYWLDYLSLKRKKPNH